MVIKISAPIKSHFAKNGGLDLQKLMGDGEYKEIYRKEMIKWGEEIRNKDHGYFCRAAIELFEAKKKPIWIVSDIRRRTDILWFSETFKDAVITYRIVASDDVRKSRGWVFTEGIDNAESECDLDTVDSWDHIVENNGNLDDLKSKVDSVVNVVNEKLLEKRQA